MVLDLTSGNPELGDIHARAREAASVVDDLIASARAETAPPDVVPDELDIAAICRRLLLTMPGGDKVDVDIRATKVWADPELTTQIVTGMLGNTIRYGGPNMRLQIFNSGPDTVVQLIDDGPGITAAAQEQIFSSDLRQGQPVTRPAAVGLSLSVGRHLARRMEGEFTYRRSGDGFNIFELRLPSEELTRTRQPRPRPSLGVTAD
jgi:signal transduction histidine kinase